MNMFANPPLPPPTSKLARAARIIEAVAVCIIIFGRAGRDIFNVLQELDEAGGRR